MTTEFVKEPVDDHAHSFPTISPPCFHDSVVYLPIRHHSPACAFHVNQLILERKPALVLIEGPRDATHLIPYLLHKESKPPFAFYATFIDQETNQPFLHHGAYYPLSEYSPEFVAIQAAKAVSAEVRFIDLRFSETVLAEKARHIENQSQSSSEINPTLSSKEPSLVRSLQDESYFNHNQFLNAACKKVGARDADDLWDCLFEHHFRQKDSMTFFHQVLSFCALSRKGYTPEDLHRELHDVREEAMAAEIEHALKQFPNKQIFVITGGFHTVALPKTRARHPAFLSKKQEGAAAIHLIRYGFEQLDRLQGYASGMPSPEFYQRLWQNEDFLELLTEIARELRVKKAEPSPAEVISAYEHIKRLAAFRGHFLPTREDFLDGIRSSFIKGSMDIEGVFVMSVAQKHLTGNRIGKVAREAGRPALVLDFERILEKERLALQSNGEHEIILDLYRSSQHRSRSRFFHQLQLLDVPFASLIHGPNYASSQNLERMTEVWRYLFRPSTEASLIEQSRYGSTVEEAATSVLQQKFLTIQQAKKPAEHAAKLIVKACRCGLQKQVPSLLEQTKTLIVTDPDFCSVVAASMEFNFLHSTWEPLEAHDIQSLQTWVTFAWEHAASMVPFLGATHENEEPLVLDALCTFSTLEETLPAEKKNSSIWKDLKIESLQELAKDLSGNSCILGAAFGLLFSEGALTGIELGKNLAGFLGSASLHRNKGAQFLQGLLFVARSVCWIEPSVLDAVHETLVTISEEQFFSMLPHLRLAFSNLTPKECDRIAQEAAKRCGVSALQPIRTTQIKEADILLGARIYKRVSEIFHQDGWPNEND